MNTFSHLSYKELRKEFHDAKDWYWRTKSMVFLEFMLEAGKELDSRIEKGECHE